MPSERKESERLKAELDELMKSNLALRRKLIVEEGRLDVLARVLGYEVYPFHWLLIQAKRTMPGPWRLFLAPRGAGKSTIITVVDSVMLGLQNSDTRVLIASRVKDQAKDILKEIQGCFEAEEFQELFGDLRGDEWGKGHASLQRRRKYKEPTYMAAGADGPVTSKHFDNIKVDDLVDETNSRTEGEREKIKVFFYKTVLPTLQKVRADGSPGEMDIIGTRYQPDDIYGHIIEHEPRVKNSICVVPALVNPETGEADVSEIGVSVVPEILPTKELKIDRISMGSAHFDSQNQQDTHRMRGDIFKDEEFRYYDDDPVKIVQQMGLKVWAASDLAVAEKQINDEYADAVIGVDDRHGPMSLDIYVLEYFSGRPSFGAQLDRVDHIFAKWDPIRFGIEANAFQATRLRSIQRERGSEIGDRCVPIYTTVDKVTRAWKLQARYEAGRVYHRKGHSEKLEDQLVGFPKKKLKDIFDALDLAVTLGCVMRIRRKRPKRLGVIGGRARATSMARRATTGVFA